MTERGWLLRDAVLRIMADAPLPPATWPSVARRVVVVLGCVVAGLVLGDPQAGILAAFGAVQVGLIEAALPLRSLLRMLALLLLACLSSVFVALLLGGTWWIVPILGIIAYLFGATAGLSPSAMSIGISTLALAVIFAGMPQDLPGAIRDTICIGSGMLAQAIAWLLVWRPERMWFMRRALANKLRSDVRMLRTGDLDVPTLVRAHAQTDAAVSAIIRAGLPEDQERRLLETLSAMVRLSRALIAWLILRSPGEADRIAVGLELQTQIRRLSGLRPAGTRPDVTIPGETMSVEGLREAVDGLDRAVDDQLAGRPPTGTPLIGPSAAAEPPPAHRSLLAVLLPDGRPSRYGLRMLIGITVAQAIAMVFPAGHGFWLPLTVVFTLRPDWTFTVIRGLNRTVGNLAAVIFLPSVFFLFGGSSVILLIPLAVLSALAFRFLMGNYVIASFGLAGSVLVLDYALEPGTDLLFTRVVAVILGSLFSLVVALAIPSWSSSTGPQQAAELIACIRRWRHDVTTRLTTGTGVDDITLDADIAATRRALLQLDPTSTGALLEPRRQVHAIELALLMATGVREVAALLASSAVALMAPDLEPERGQRVIERSRLPERAAAFDRAAAAYRTDESDGEDAAT